MALGGFRVFEPGEDHDLYLRMAEVGKLINLPSIVTGYRYRPESFSRQNLRVVRINTLIAARNSVLRSQDRSEITYQELSQFKKFALKGRASLYSASQGLYRKGLCVNSRWIRISLFTLAGILQPAVAIERVKRVLQTQ